MLLEDLLAQESVDVEGRLDLDITEIVCDSRQVGARSLFVAIRGGQEVDRHAFVADAVRRGAAAIVVEEEVECAPATRILARDARTLLPRLASRFFHAPAEELLCTAVTGTNGKTTTTWLLHHIQQASGQRSAYLGTMGYISRDREVAVANTTPEAPTLQQLLRSARSEGVTSISMEVSSHALALRRTDGIAFAAAVFTNLTRDHLDFHGTTERYTAAKARLFEELGSDSTAVLNRDDPAWKTMAASSSAKILTFSVEDATADLRPVSVQSSIVQTRCVLTSPQGEFEVVSPLTGRFNLSNIMAAVAAAVALGIEADAVCEGIATAPRVPGRFERIDEGQPFGVLVDYAHTPAGLQTVLEAARELTQGRLLCVFGCGGDRDNGKRPLMGRVAEDLADLVFLTSDNPRSELPEQILEQIRRGMVRPTAARADTNRQVAIEEALNEACPGDVVVIAGKGDEPYQLLADGPIDFDDRDVARDVLRRIRQ